VVIEDEPYLCVLIKEILEATGEFAVMFANDGVTGMELCLAEAPDVVLLDYILPQNRGDQVAKFLKANNRTAKIPVVLMSALTEGIYLDEMEIWQWLSHRPVMNSPDGNMNVPKWERMPEEIVDKFGVAAFIPKPFSKEILLEVLRADFSK
jgi:CheY-like chemotaxis protein